MENQRPSGSFFKDSASLLANNLGMFAVSVLSSVLIARGLGPEGKGIYSIALLFPTLLASLGSMGMNTASIYFLNREPTAKPAITGAAMAYAAAAGLLLTLLTAAFSGSISSSFLGGAGTVFVIAAAPLLPLLMFFETSYCFFMASRDIKNISIMNAIRSFSHLAIAGTLFLAGSLTVLNTIVSQATAAAAALAFGAYALNAGGFFNGITLQPSVLRRMTAFGLRQHIGTAAQTLNYRIDMFIAAALLSPYQVGLYSVSLAMSELLWHVPNAAGQVLYPKTAASSKAEADRFTPEVARHVFYLTLIPAAVVWTAAAPLTGLLFGHNFLPASGPIKLLLPGAVLLSVSKVLGSHLSAGGNPQYNSTASAISLFFSAALCLLLIPRMGLAGAATATSLSYLANFCVMFYFFRKVSGCGPAEIFLPQRGDLTFYRGLLARFLKL